MTMNKHAIALALTATVTLASCQQLVKTQPQVETVTTAPVKTAAPAEPEPVNAVEEHRNKGDRKGHDMADKIPKREVPPAPVLSVAQALASFQAQEQFVVENVVSDPNIFNPIAISFDANGRMWVPEMTRFMPDTLGTGEYVPEGNIAVLEDRDGDGKVDKRTVFLNDVILPRTVTQVKGGILYADNTQLYFTEVLEQDGELVPGLREVVDPTYAKGGSVEHKTNTMLYGMDNWYYNAKSDKKYQTLALDADVPAGAEEIYRNRYWKLVRGVSDYRGQWGLTMDDYGRLFHNGNSDPARGEYLMPGSLLKNSGFWPKIPAPAIGDKRIYSIRMNTGINRGYMDGMLETEGENRGKLMQFTAASGSVIYRGDNFPERFYGMAITPEPAANLISARQVIDGEGALSGEPLYPQAEIFASTDERFRPVNLYTAPDGSLYIVDMYHGIIQHKEFLTSYLSDQIHARELDKNNNTMGRIYRLRWGDKPLGEQPRLHQLPSKALVEHLAHSNGWWRDTARRLLIEANDATVAPQIESLISVSRDSRAIINGLWTLHGLNRVTWKTLEPLLQHDDTHVVNTALMVSERLPTASHSALVDTFSQLVKRDYRTALHVALIAGAMDSPRAFDASIQVLDHYIDKPLVREAVLSGAATRSADFVEKLGQYPDEALMYAVNNLGKKPSERSNRALLSEQGQALYDDGKTVFNGKAACFGCHGPDGDGIKGMGSSFWGSDIVLKDKQGLSKVILHGLANLKRPEWPTSMVMPGSANNPGISDKDIAALATYMRNSWGNAADTGAAVTEQDVRQARDDSADQTVPYGPTDLMELGL